MRIFRKLYVCKPTICNQKADKAQLLLSFYNQSLRKSSNFLLKSHTFNYFLSRIIKITYTLSNIIILIQTK